MEFRILGSLEVRTSGRALELRGGKSRALLTALLLRRNEVVSISRLIEDLWETDQPTSARQMVKGYVSQLRRELAAGGDGHCLITEPAGYRLDLEGAQLDSEQFERLLAAGDEALTEHRWAEAAAFLREALDLWRGPALADFAYATFAANEARRLEDLRLLAVEQRIAADLELGRHTQLVSELGALVREHPLRERLSELLMLALYRCDRGAQALDVYTAVRLALDELGLEPGPSLRQLQHSILLHDPALRPPDEAAVELTPPPGSPKEEQGAIASPGDRRKTVTIIVCQVAESEELGEPLDPEVHRAALHRFGDTASAVLTRHGGTIEAFTGDAIVGVFGVPTVREDDSLRAVRAALELRHEVATLNADLEDELTLSLKIRIGLDTGEVVVGDILGGRSIITGDVVKVATRLQQSAAANEVLLSEATLELVRGEVKVKPRRPLVSRGTTRATRAFRLLGLAHAEPAITRRFEAPLVGRGDELIQLRQAFARCVGGNSAMLFTLLGPAGIGKSRLAGEACTEFARQARVLHGACLPYGERITFLPLRQMLTQMFGEHIQDGLAATLALQPDPDRMATSVARLLGIDTDDDGGLEEEFLGVRHLLESIAVEQPVVLVFDDVHWAEPALLDLIEYLADLARATPIFLLCLARQELLEQRTAWAGGKPNATTILLDPLASDDSAQLVDWLLRDNPPGARARARVLERGDGNPLFLEQLCAHESGGDPRDADVGLPPTILALLATRVDRLDPAERTVLEHAAIVGNDFDRAALAEFAPADIQPFLGARLDSLVRKELVRPAMTENRERETYRFRHVLIRDAAYRSISKAERVALHERFAGWLDVNRGADEFCDELVGYHLEQAHRNRLDLRMVDDETVALARHASERLERASRRAESRNDEAATAALLERAALLLPEGDRLRVSLLSDAAAALLERGDIQGADRILTGALDPGFEDPPAEIRVRVEQQLVELQRSTADTATAKRLAGEAIAILEQRGDQRGLSRAWRLAAFAAWVGAQAGDAGTAWERAAHHAHADGNELERAGLLSWVPSCLWVGPTPVEEAIARTEEIREVVKLRRASGAEVLRCLAALHGFAGHFDLARALFAESTAVFTELGLGLRSVPSHQEAKVAMLAGDYGHAEECLRMSYDALEAMGERSIRSTTAALLAHVSVAQDRMEEAEKFAGIAQDLAPPDDVLTHILSESAYGRILSSRGLHEAAELHARSAVALAAATDFVSFHADALVDLAGVLESAGSGSASSSVRAEAYHLYERKGNIVGTRQTRAGLDVRASA